MVDGDALSASIAAASIVAKVTRDLIMQEYAQIYPAYGFERQRPRTWDHISEPDPVRAVAVPSLVICASVASG